MDSIKSQMLCESNIVSSSLSSITCDCLAEDSPKGFLFLILVMLLYLLKYGFLLFFFYFLFCILYFVFCILYFVFCILYFVFSYFFFFWILDATCYGNTSVDIPVGVSGACEGEHSLIKGPSSIISFFPNSTADLCTKVSLSLFDSYFFKEFLVSPFLIRKYCLFFFLIFFSHFLSFV